MKRFGRKRRLSRKSGLIIICISIALFVGGVVTLRVWYSNSLKPVSSSMKIQYFTVEQGSGLQEIAGNLKKAGLIRNTQSFETYVRSSEFHSSLQAGTYSLSPSMSVQEIFQKMVNGDIAKNLLTILPGKRLDQIKQTFAKAGYSQAEIATAFNPATYTGTPLLAGLPAGASLEGFLYPDSFQKLSNTPASTIISESLDEMQQKLTPDIISSFSNQDLNVYQGVTLASIVEQESDDPTYQPTIAQVFLLRLKQNMMLQSNVTANYAADTTNQPRSVNIDSPYNTYLHPGLTPGPISNVTADSLKAVAHPSDTTYLYFVAGDNGNVYFSSTEQEHEAAIQQYCPTKCAQ